MDSDPTSLLSAAAAILLSVLSAQLLARLFGAPPQSNRYLSIDGLRGYLAFFVYLHHACIWYFYLKTGSWVGPPTNLYAHFGQSSVVLFFTITGFLFFSKIIDSRTQPIDWLKLFVSRFLRLTPLYLFAVGVLVSIVLKLTNWTLHEPLSRFTGSVIQWLGFTIFGSPDLNGVPQTLHIMAGVTWTLPYECFFYLSLPVLALCVRVVAPTQYIILSALSIWGFYTWIPQRIHLLAFLGGIIAALLVQEPRFRRLCNHQLSSFVVVGIVCVVVTVFPYAYSVVPILLLACAFALIAGGNSVFGILTTSASRTLGELAYSIYLLHGVFLFILINFILGPENASLLSAPKYWLSIIVSTPFLILLSYGTFRLIEKPAMQKTGQFTEKLRTNLRYRRRNFHG